ncbi:inorganic triphosphatase YgiF [Sinorhizobium fredii]
MAAACVKQFRLNEMALSWSRNADALDQARVSLRRLRSLFSICKSLFADSRFDHMRDELRWLASELGDARNIDVIKRASDEGFSSGLQAARNDAYGAVDAAFSSLRARSLMIDLAEWISIKNWRSNETGEALLVQPARNFASDEAGDHRPFSFRVSDFHEEAKYLGEDEIFGLWGCLIPASSAVPAAT